MHIRTDNICREVGGTSLLEDVSLEARAGFILGILAPRGAGKTTLLRIILDMVPPDSGTVTYDDHFITRRVRNAMGYLPQQRGLLPQYSLNRTLVHFARLRGLSRKRSRVEAVRLMDRFNMIEQMDVPVAELSENMRQKLLLMVTMVHNPDLLVLDEPFTGFDAPNQALLGKILRRFREEGKTIIIATEHMNEASGLCDEIVMLRHGRILLQDKMENIRERIQEHLVLIKAVDGASDLKRINGVKRVLQERDELRLYIDNSVKLQQTLNNIINQVPLHRIEVSQAGLEDVYLELTRKQKSRS